MARVFNSLTKKKTKSTRFMAVLLATVIMTLSIDIRPAYSAAPLVAGAAELLFGGMMSAYGVTFGSRQDLSNAFNDFSIRFPSSTVTSEELAEIRTVYHYKDNGELDYIDTLGNALHRGDMDFVIEMSMQAIGEMAEEIANGFKDFIKTKESPDGEVQNILDNQEITGYYNGIALRKPLEGGYTTFTDNGITNYTQAMLNTLEVYRMGGSIYHRNGTTILRTDVKKSGNRYLVYQNQFVAYITEGEMTNAYNYTANLQDINIIQRMPEAVANIARLGGVSIPPSGGTYNSEDRVGLKASTNLDAFVSKDPMDLIVDISKDIDLPIQPTTAPTTQPTPDPSPEPTSQPSPKPIIIPKAPIISGLDSVQEKVNGILQQVENTPNDYDVAGALANLMTELADIKERINEIPEDDPNAAQRIQEMADEIQQLQQVIEEQEQIIGSQPEIYPDELLDELADTKRELQELEDLMNNTEEPLPATDYTNLLERILAKLNEVKTAVVTAPETLTQAVKEIPDKLIGDMVIETNTDSEDPDLDWSMVFPFCIPFDLARMFESLVSEGAPPRFEAEIMGYPWVIDFADYEFIRGTIRWALWLTFVICLMVMTSRVIKWH